MVPRGELHRPTENHCGRRRSGVDSGWFAVPGKLPGIDRLTQDGPSELRNMAGDDKHVCVESFNL